MKSRKALFAVALAAGLGSVAAPVLADVYCPPNLGPVTIDDNVIVENGQCVLNGTQVKGSVLVKPNGALTVRDARIEGNIQADGGIYVRVLRTNVGGDIQLEGVSGEVSRIQRSSIGGNLQLDSNRVRLVAEYNAIDGDLQAFGNTGGAVIRYNTIDGSLQCKSNSPAPTGGFNQVSGNKEDQCAGL
jgi:hypothetical protein